jgi:hypothetical protein
MPSLPEQFSPVLCYTVRDSQPEDIEWLASDLLDENDVVYARVYKDRVVYVGSCDRTLRKRMKEHLLQWPLDQSQWRC